MRTNIGFSFCFLGGFSVFWSSVAASLTEQFHEELSIRPLLDGKITTTFVFTSILEKETPRNPEIVGLDEDAAQHYTLFPLTLGQILREYSVTELHLTLNAGKWNYDRWDYPDEPGVGTGAEMWAWMGAPATIDQRWRGLRNALAGLFCASLGALDEQRTTSPVQVFSPEVSLPSWSDPHQLRHATLPSEHVCTENLTPFLKLLPCKSLSGLASLLNSHRVFDADWHGMGAHVTWHEDEGVRVRLTFQAVFDPVRSSPIRKRDWSFKSVFDRDIERACPVAQSSRVNVALPRSTIYALTPDPGLVEGNTATFDLENRTYPFQIEMQWPTENEFRYPLGVLDQPLSDISAQRTLRGSNQARGQLSVIIKNNKDDQLRLIYLETMPWFLQFYLHTLRVTSNGVIRNDLMSDVLYSPPVPHSRPTTFQSILTLPPRATIHITIDVTKAFLRYTEHPPDAQRGWDLPPAVLAPVLLDNDNTTATLAQKVYTSALLIDLATPDFSMPYNVIIMTCSLMAMIFGSVFNLLTRRFVVVQVRPSTLSEPTVDGRQKIN